MSDYFSFLKHMKRFKQILIVMQMTFVQYKLFMLELLLLICRIYTKDYEACEFLMLIFELEWEFSICLRVFV